VAKATFKANTATRRRRPSQADRRRIRSLLLSGRDIGRSAIASLTENILVRNCLCKIALRGIGSKYVRKDPATELTRLDEGMSQWKGILFLSLHSSLFINRWFLTEASPSRDQA
jgi:hypothetical protein